MVKDERDDDKGDDRESSDEREPREDRDATASRRELLKTAVGVGLGFGGLSLLAAAEGLRPRIAESPTTEPPKAGDLLSFAKGSRKGELITAGDLASGGPQILAWPMDPRLHVIKSASQHNLIVVVRAAQPSWLASSIKPYAAGEVVAYSAICTHLCCTVADWRRHTGPHGSLFCPCHLSTFDPWDGGKVLSGPAPRPLPELPLKSSDKHLEVAAKFLGPIGCSEG